MDQVQLWLVEYSTKGDRQAHGQAVDALYREWRPRLRNFPGQVSPEELDELLQTAVTELAVIQEGKLRALAPPHAQNPGSWRATVLKNWWRDTIRKKRRRDHVRTSVEEGWSPQVGQDQWNLEREQRQLGGAEANVEQTIEVRRSGTEGDRAHEDLAERIGNRHAILVELPKLPVRRAVLIIMAMKGDPIPFAQALADELDEPVEQVVERMHLADEGAHDQAHDYLTQAMVDVVYPPGSAANPRAAALRALNYAIKDLGERLS